MLTRRTVILAGRESTYASVATITGTDGILAFDVDVDVQGEVLMRDVMRDTLTPLPHVIGMKQTKVTFKTELKGGGVVGTGADVPEIDALLYGCGFNTAAITGTDRTYNLGSIEGSMGSITLNVYKDGNLHQLLGARGTVKFVLEAGKYGVCEFEFDGKYVAVSAITIPDISGLDVTKPPIVYDAGFQIGGFVPVCSSATIDLGNNVVRRDDLNDATGVNGFRLAGREPKMEYNTDAVVEASNPFWGDWAGDIVSTYDITIGGTAGNKVAMSGFIQIETNKYGDADGVSQYEIVSSLCSSNADTSEDELVIKFA